MATLDLMVQMASTCLVAYPGEGALHKQVGWCWWENARFNMQHLSSYFGNCTCCGRGATLAWLCLTACFAGALTLRHCLGCPGRQTKPPHELCDLLQNLRQVTQLSSINQLLESQSHMQHKYILV
jgi:hypothetical protein